MAQKILLVDDESNIRDLNALYLEKEGYAVEHATNGTEALARFAQSPPAMVVLDVMMPGMDGPETLKILRASEETAHIPVVFLTAKGMAAHVSELEALGADGIILKPFDPLTLAAEVMAIIES